MRRLRINLVCVVTLAGLPAGCTNERHGLTIAGRIASADNVTESFLFEGTTPLLFVGDSVLRDAEVAIVVGQAGGDVVLASTKSAADGSFTLKYPEPLPEGAFLRVASPGHEPYRQRLSRPGPSYWEIGVALKIIKSA